MESDLPTPIDDSLPFNKKVSFQEQRDYDEDEEEDENPRYFQPPPQWMYPPPPPQQQQPQKSRDIFSELERIHWIIFFACIVLAFFMGKSISTPIIIRSS